MWKIVPNDWFHPDVTPTSALVLTLQILQTKLKYCNVVQSNKTVSINQSHLHSHQARCCQHTPSFSDVDSRLSNSGAVGRAMWADGAVVSDDSTTLRGEGCRCWIPWNEIWQPTPERGKNHRHESDVSETNVQHFHNTPLKLYCHCHWDIDFLLWAKNKKNYI